MVKWKNLRGKSRGAGIKKEGGDVLARAEQK